MAEEKLFPWLDVSTFAYLREERGLCLYLLCLHLTVADVPGPCRYSVRTDHLATVRRLIENQLKNGCSMTYTFTERGNLSDTCYIKAAFPQILKLFNTHFKFSRGSDNWRYVEVMKALIYNMYSQKCIPPINEELEDDPEKFSKIHGGSPREALERILEVFSLYVELMSTRNIPVHWSCEEEYAMDEPQFTTPLAQTTGAPLAQTTGAAECRCFNPAVDYGDSHQVSFSTGAPGQAPLLLGTTDPTAAHFTTGGTSSRVDYGMNSGNGRTDGVFLPSAELPFLSAIGTEHLTELSSASSVKMVTFLKKTDTPLFDTESDTSSVFSEASELTDDTPLSYRSQGVTRVMDVSVSTTDLEERSASTASGSSRDPTQSTSGTPNFKTDSLVKHAIFEPRVATISSRVFMGHPPTPVPLQEFQVEGTPRRPKASVAVPLAKRSVEPRQDRSQLGLSTNPAYPRSGATSASQLPPFVSMMTARDEAALGAVLDHFSSSEKTWQGDGETGSPKTAAPSRAPKTWLGDGVGRLPGLPILAIRPNPSPDPESEAVTRETSNKEAVGSADPLEQNTRTHFQSGDPEGSHDSNMLAYIMAPVCGGLLFIGATVYCLRRQKKLQEFLQCFRMTENQSTDLELQDFQAMTEPCLKSSSREQL